MPAQILKYLDSRNQPIWEEALEEYEIAVEQSNQFSVFTIGKKATIYVERSSFCKDSFTHELLHIYLHKKGILIGNILKRKFINDSCLAKVFSEENLDQLGNLLEHSKMLPIYLRLGFDRTKFIVDFHKNCCPPSLLKWIQ
jgi:hypothetical protein